MILNSLNLKKKNVHKIGIYYDDPALVEKGKQRYAIGFVLDDSFRSEIDYDLFKQNGYKFQCLNKIDNAVLADFPCCTELSILLSVWLVYPRLKKFIKVKNSLKFLNF